MKVLVADKFEAIGLDGLKQMGADVVYEPDLVDAALGARLRETKAVVLIVRSTKVTADMLEGASLGLIIRAGAGYNTIDVKAASTKGILVSNCPGKNGKAVAELAFGLMLAIDRRIPDNVADIHAGKWNKKEYSKGRGLHGRMLGLIGMGNISQEMIPRAKAFGMYVNCFSRWMLPDVAAALGIGRSETLEDVARQSDVVSVHVALTPETRGMIGKEFFDAMKDGATFLNTSRAEVVDQGALLEAVSSGRIFAGLDVFEGEPAGGTGAYDGPLKDCPNVYCTHHIGASTLQAQEAVALETVRIVKEYKLTGVAPNVVNVRGSDTAEFLMVVRHADRVGVLAHILEQLRHEHINIQEMENIVLGGSQAAIAQMSMDKEPSADCLHNIKLNAAIFDAQVMPIHRDH
ncbi:MAG: hypothetical protein KIS66_17535 [Fimbriimonadaceae bacterium]|nr:hypothetical protein [Fimbriimonadaceae bacterium]